MAKANRRWAFCTDAWASASRSLSYTTSWPKSSRRSRPVASDERGDLLVGIAAGGQLGNLQVGEQAELLELLETTSDERQRVERDGAVGDRDPVDQTVTLEEIHGPAVRPLDHDRDEVLHVGVRQHAEQAALDGGPRPGCDHRFEALELVRQRLVQHGIDVDGAEDLRGEVLGEGGRYLRLRRARRRRCQRPSRC